MSASSRPPRFRARILVVEDDATLREGMAESLRLDGLEVFEASNGAVGLEVALTKSPQIVVFDYTMPVADGPMLVAELREVVRPMPVLVAISAAGSVQTWCRDQGIPVFLLKPFDDATMRRAIDAAIGQAIESNRPRPPSKSGTRAATRPAFVVVVGSRDDGEGGLRDALPESMRHARIVVVASAEEGARILDWIVPDLLVLDDLGAHDSLRALATLRAIPILVRPPNDGANPRLVEPPPPSSNETALRKK
jgi:DNA-binding response OmpR family regulator